MGSTVVVTRLAEETQALGRRLGRLAQPGDLVLLHGTLGAGKTTFTQGVAWGVEASDYAHSPTFVIVHEYHGRIALFHVDLYRLGDPLEIHDLAVDEMLESGACVVEWPERAGGTLPDEHLAVDLEFTSVPGERRITLTPHGERYTHLVSELGREPRQD